MPRRSRQRRQRVTYGDGHRLHLETGHDWWGDGFGSGDDFDREAAVDAWSELRAEILLAHVEASPCSRPWAWWALEEHPPRQAARRPRGATREPARPFPWDERGSWWPWWQRYLAAPWIESEAAYLARQGMLTRREADYLAAHPELLKPVNGSLLAVAT